MLGDLQAVPKNLIINPHWVPTAAHELTGVALAKKPRGQTQDDSRRKSTSAGSAPPTSSATMATTPGESTPGAQDRATLRQGWPLDLTKQQAFWFDSDLTFGYLQSDKFPPAWPPDDGQLPKQRGRPPDDEQSHRQSLNVALRPPDDEQLPRHRGRPPGDRQSPVPHDRIPRILAGQPYGAATKTAQAQDTDGRGGNKEITPQGQGQGRVFCCDFAQPGQVVRGGTAAPDATKGLTQLGPAATSGPVQPRARFCQQGAKSPVMATLGEEHTFQLQVSEMRPGRFAARSESFRPFSKSLARPDVTRTIRQAAFSLQQLQCENIRY